ncbi:MAG: DEAD/DEAH box helicase [Bacillota bacterium]|jgi:ATP-dependent RNA helicase DeaD
MNNLIFAQLNLSPEVQKAIKEMGFEEATPIQSQAIPYVMAGKDVIGQAQTGTGKTCAFGIPVIEMIKPEIKGLQVLVLCPTRELTIQTAEELTNVAKYKRGIKILPIYGGQPIERQIIALKQNPQIIIGTPGRIMDHMRRKTLKLKHLRILTLDEADEMLNMGFREDVDTILADIPQEKQTIFFSATMPQAILDLTAKYQKEPLHIKVTHSELTVPSIEQYYLEAREAAKLDVLARLIDANNYQLALVFCNTKKRVDEVASHLQSRGYMAEALHGDMTQAQRDKVMTKFRKGRINILIATDVAARGIDVDDIEAVFNYDIPSDEEYYVHRIGRTGRAGKAGRAYTFVSGRDFYKLKDIQRFTKSTILPLKPPSLLDVEETKVNQIMESIKQTIANGKLNKYITYIEKMLEETADGNENDNYLTSLDIAAAFLKMALGPEYEKDPLDSNLNRWRDDSDAKVRLFINVGHIDKLQPRDILQSIASATGIPKKLIGAIEILDKFTFVEVPREYATEVITGLKDSKINGRRVNIEKANRKPGKSRAKIERTADFKH